MQTETCVKGQVRMMEKHITSASQFERALGKWEQELAKCKKNWSRKGSGESKDHEHDMIWFMVLRSSAVRSQMVSGCSDSGFCKVDMEERQRQGSYEQWRKRARGKGLWGQGKMKEKEGKPEESWCCAGNGLVLARGSPLGEFSDKKRKRGGRLKGPDFAVREWEGTSEIH